MNDVIDCYCGDDEDDGLMVCCEQCKKWQHAQCVNVNKFSEPIHYVCPSCRGINIGCRCGYEADYQKSLVFCVVCHEYFHKRHVGIGYGMNPSTFVCSDCSKGEFRYKEEEVMPIPSFLPHLNVAITVKPISEMDPPLPKGQLLDKLSSITGQTSVGALCAYLYSNFRSVIFQSHSTVKFLTIKRYMLRSRANSSWDFMCAMIKAVEFMTGSPKHQIIQMLDHLISVDIYKKPIPDVSRVPTNEFITECPDIDNAYDYSERAEDEFLDEEPKFQPDNLSGIQYKQLKIVNGTNGTRTVIAVSEIKSGELICPVYGNLLMMEEVDSKSMLPKYEIYRIGDTDIALDTTELPKYNIFQQIRRGFISNCEIRPFDVGDNRYLGIFATQPIAMPVLFAREIREDYTIQPGMELVLPFDIAPPAINFDMNWATEQLNNELEVEETELVQPPISTAKMREIMEQTHQSKSGEKTKSKPKRTTQVNTLKSLFSGPFYIDINLTGEDTTDQSFVLNEDLPEELSQFAPPGRKSWLRKSNAKHKQMPVSHPWFNELSIEQKFVKKTQKQNESGVIKPQKASMWEIPDDDTFLNVGDIPLAARN